MSLSLNKDGQAPHTFLAIMKLDRVELLHVRRRLHKPFKISVGAISAREFVVLRGWSDGVAVYSEANIDARPFYASETIGTVWQILRQVLLPSVLGVEFDAIESVRQTWANVRGHDYAKAALEHLYWDLQGKIEGRSIRELLGGADKRVEMGTSHSIGSDLNSYAQDIDQALSLGIRRIKVKIQPGWDRQPLELLRRQFGDITLMADANAAYQAEHIDHLASLDDLGMLMLEQPLPPLDLVHHSHLAPRMTTPLCLDEGAHDLSMVENAAAFGACRIINIKVGRVGGLTNAKAIHDWCYARGIPVWCGRRTGSGITIASELALSTLPGFAYPTGGGNGLIMETLDHPVPIEQFQRDQAWVKVPESPGIGVEVDDDLLQNLTLHQETFHSIQ